MKKGNGGNNCVIVAGFFCDGSVNSQRFAASVSDPSSKLNSAPKICFYAIFNLDIAAPDQSARLQDNYSHLP
jgi:hypothetical protein